MRGRAVSGDGVCTDTMVGSPRGMIGAYGARPAEGGEPSSRSASTPARRVGGGGAPGGVGSRRGPDGQEPSGAVFKAGQVVRPGTYRRMDVPNGRVVDLRDREALPASVDGTVALYRRVTPIDVRAVGE